TAVLAVRPAMVSVAAFGAERAGRWAAPLSARMDRKSGALGGLGACASDSVLWRTGFSLGVGLRPAGVGLFAGGMDKLRAIVISSQPSAALSGLFLCRLRGWRLWPRPRAACHRWLAGAALGRLARRFDRWLCAVGVADIADGGWRPGAVPRADRRGARFRRGLRVRLLRPDGAVPSFRPRTDANSRQSFGQCLHHVSPALRLYRLAAIRAVARRPVRD